MPSRCGSSAANRFGGTPAEVADRFSEALRSLFRGGCVAHDAPPRRALRRFSKRKFGVGRPIYSRPTVPSVGKAFHAQRLVALWNAICSGDQRCPSVTSHAGLLKLHALFIAESMTARALSPEQRVDSGELRLWQMLSPQTQTNLKNAKSYFEEHLAVGDYYGDAERVVGEWIGKGAEMLGPRGCRRAK